jgi:hypothetical protein
MHEHGSHEVNTDLVVREIGSCELYYSTQAPMEAVSGVPEGSSCMNVMHGMIHSRAECGVQHDQKRGERQAGEW